MYSTDMHLDEQDEYREAVRASKLVNGTENMLKYL